MPTVFTHPVVPLAIGLGLGRKVIPTHLIAAGIAVSVLPDMDVLAFRFGVSYASDIGHRGFSHSLVFAAIVALLGAGYYRRCFTKTFWFLFAVATSHGVLDALTNGGLGIAFFWPFSTERFFIPVRPIEVSPLSIGRFMSARGAAVMLSEILWVWLPCAVIGVCLAGTRWRKSIIKRGIFKAA